MFEILEVLFYILFFCGLISMILGIANFFMKLFLQGLKTPPRTFFKAGGILLACSCIPLALTMFV